MARRSRPILVAFAISPLAASLVLALWFFVIAGIFGGPRGGMGIGKITAVFFATSLFLGYVAAGIIGVPGYFLLRRMGWVRRRSWFLLGVTMETAAGGFLFAIGYNSTNNLLVHSIYFVAGAVLLIAPPALTTGFVFMWLIRRAGPDVEKIAATFD